MSLSPLTEILVIAGTLAAVIASIIAIYMVLLSLRVYRMTITAYTNIRDVLTQLTIQSSEAPRETQAPQTPQPPSAEHEGAVEPQPKEPHDSLTTLIEAEGLRAAMLFDETGYVVDFAGKIDAAREAALLAEVLNALRLARETTHSIYLTDGEKEILARVAELGGKNIFLYVVAPKDSETPSIEFLAQSARRAIKAMIGGG